MTMIDPATGWFVRELTAKHPQTPKDRKMPASTVLFVPSEETSSHTASYPLPGLPLSCLNLRCIRSFPHVHRALALVRGKARTPARVLFMY
jgi:hypothetical protein